MKNVGITQRVVLCDKTGERRDALHQRWFELGDAVGIRLVPIPNTLRDVVNFVESLSMHAIILSGGNNVGLGSEGPKSLAVHDVAEERDKTEAQLLQWAVLRNVPVLGVCRGLQFINCFFGGRLKSVNHETHVATHHPVDFVDEQWRKWYGAYAVVNSYHNWGITAHSLSTELIQTAVYGAEVEAVTHATKDISGIMWHPERNSAFAPADIRAIRSLLLLE